MTNTPNSDRQSRVRKILGSIGSAYLVLLGGILLLCGGILLGAILRALGLPQLNYLIAGLYLFGGLMIFFSPPSLVALAVTAVAMSASGKGDKLPAAIASYTKLLGWIILAFLVPLLIFARAPGDTSLETSFTFVVAATTVALVSFLSGVRFDRVRKFILFIAPWGVLLWSMAVMFVPPSAYAKLGLNSIMLSNDAANELALLRQDQAAAAEAEKTQRVKRIRKLLAMGLALTPDDAAFLRGLEQEQWTVPGFFQQAFNQWKARKQAEADAVRASAIAAQQAAYMQKEAARLSAEAEEKRRATAQAIWDSAQLAAQQADAAAAETAAQAEANRQAEAERQRLADWENAQIAFDTQVAQADQMLAQNLREASWMASSARSRAMERAADTLASEARDRYRNKIRDATALRDDAYKLLCTNRRCPAHTPNSLLASAALPPEMIR